MTISKMILISNQNYHKVISYKILARRKSILNTQPYIPEIKVMAHISKQEMRTIIKITTIDVTQNRKISKIAKNLGRGF